MPERPPQAGDVRRDRGAGDEVDGRALLGRPAGARAQLRHVVRVGPVQDLCHLRGGRHRRVAAAGPGLPPSGRCLRPGRVVGGHPHAAVDVGRSNFVLPLPRRHYGTDPAAGTHPAGGVGRSPAHEQKGLFHGPICVADPLGALGGAQVGRYRQVRLGVHLHSVVRLGGDDPVQAMAAGTDEDRHGGRPRIGPGQALFGLHAGREGTDRQEVFGRSVHVESRLRRGAEAQGPRSAGHDEEHVPDRVCRLCVAAT